MDIGMDIIFFQSFGRMAIFLKKSETSTPATYVEKQMIHKFKNTSA